MQAAVGRFFDLPIFILIGAMLPLSAWIDLGWKGPVFAVAILLFRRLPWWLAFKPMLAEMRHHARKRPFSAGSGRSASRRIYYLVVAQAKTDVDQIWIVGSLVVTASVVVHGISATPADAAGSAARRRRGEADGAEPEADAEATMTGRKRRPKRTESAPTSSP